MKKIITLLVVLFIYSPGFSQAPSHRVHFKYKITKNTLEQLAKKNIFLTDNKKGIIKLCEGLKVLKCLITNNQGDLVVDPWTISNKELNPGTTKTDPCPGDSNSAILNANTLYPLHIHIERGKFVGNPAKKVVLHYQTWLFGANSLAVKFRPAVTDYRDSVYNATAISGTINLGLTAGLSFGITSFTHRSTTNWSITPAASVGISSVQLAKEPLKKKINLINRVGSNFILSPAFSMIFARNDIGIIVSYGADLMMGKNSSAWAYQGKHFIGIGFSAQLKL